MEHNNFSEKDFKECLGNYSTGIAIIAIRDDEFNLHGIIASSFTSVSFNPPLVLFAVDKSHEEINEFIHTEYFAVSILPSSQHEIVKHFEENGEAMWKNVKHVIGATGSPIIVPNLSFMECENFANFETGDRHIIIGKVINLEVAKSDKKNPLIYFRGMYHHSPDAI